MKNTTSNGKMSSMGISEVGEFFMAVANFSQFSDAVEVFGTSLKQSLRRHQGRVARSLTCLAMVEHSVCPLKPVCSPGVISAPETWEALLYWCPSIVSLVLVLLSLLPKFVVI